MQNTFYRKCPSLLNVRKASCQVSISLYFQHALRLTCTHGPDQQHTGQADPQVWLPSLLNATPHSLVTIQGDARNRHGVDQQAHCYQHWQKRAHFFTQCLHTNSWRHCLYVMGLYRDPIHSFRANLVTRSIKTFTQSKTLLYWTRVFI